MTPQRLYVHLLRAFLTAFFLGIWAVPLRAAEPVKDTWKASAWVETHPYFNQAGHKLGFGILNMGCGWLSLFYEPVRPGGFFKGAARGIAYSVIYTGGGALHAATFPFPFDIRLPKGGMSFEQA